MRLAVGTCSWPCWARGAPAGLMSCCQVMELLLFYPGGRAQRASVLVLLASCGGGGLVLDCRQVMVLRLFFAFVSCALTWPYSLRCNHIQPQNREKRCCLGVKSWVQFPRDEFAVLTS